MKKHLCSLFNHFSIDEHLSCSEALSFINNAAMNILYTFVHLCDYFYRWISESVIPESEGMCSKTDRIRLPSLKVVPKYSPASSG